MDLLDIIRKEVDKLPNGEHVTGLQSVLRHIEAAYRHLARGQEQQDESAFTDAVYRTNQAFEGSIKEAYRVLAEKDPKHTTPYNIEKYLAKNGIFRSRVLAQFTNYRTEWRNPATHDYNLDFDEDEAFLAIVAVSAFTKLLVDQIAERIAYVTVRQDIQHHRPIVQDQIQDRENLTARVTTIFEEFLHQYVPSAYALPIETERQLLGALAGFISSIAPDLKVSTEYSQEHSPYQRADMVVFDDNQKIIVELKRSRAKNYILESSIRQLDLYMMKANATAGILLLYSTEATDYKTTIVPTDDAKRQIAILQPAQGASLSSELSNQS